MVDALVEVMDSKRQYICIDMLSMLVLWCLFSSKLCCFGVHAHWGADAARDLFISASVHVRVHVYFLDTIKRIWSSDLLSLSSAFEFFLM